MTAAELPVVIAPRREVLRNPSTLALADKLGLTESLRRQTKFSMLRSSVPDRRAWLPRCTPRRKVCAPSCWKALAPGGQAGTSSKIENYLGFPTGISGEALAGRAQVQAQKFGARLAIARAVTGIDLRCMPYRLRLEDDRSVAARAVVIATGARYRKLDVADYERFEGQGIHYAATAMEQQLCEGEEVVIVGGGNSAGQAAVFLSRTRSARAHSRARCRTGCDDVGLSGAANRIIAEISHCIRLPRSPHSPAMRSCAR